MQTKHNLHITPRDRLLFAWETSMTLVRTYQAYADETAEDEKATAFFRELAETECQNASRLLALIHERD